jgi:hypothetical protein
MTQEAPLFAIDDSVRGLELSSGTESPEDWEVFGALQEFNKPQPISLNWAIYNTIFMRVPGISGTISLSRAVDMRKIKEGEPDWNTLVVCFTDPSGNSQRLNDLDLPVDEIGNWEDLRVGANGKLGLTAVSHDGGEYCPHPALVEVGIKDGNLKVVGAPKIFKNLTGKNVIPLENGFIYRPDGVSHELHYIDPQGKLLKIIDFSNFRNIEWLSKKMGATARPIKLEDGLMLLLIHGIREGMGIDGKSKNVIYTIGIAVLDELWNVMAVDNEPLLERKDFLGNLQLNEDLHPEKEVVYLCDYMKGKYVLSLTLPVNVGDRKTVFTRISDRQLRARIKNLL